MADNDHSSNNLFATSILGHLAAQWYANETGSQLLHFKGPFATLDYPERRGNHTDSDILVQRHHITKVADTMCEDGWEEYSSNREGLDGHGWVLQREGFPITVDLHHYFPGLRENWEAAFTQMWNRRHHGNLLTEPALDLPDQIDHGILLLLDSVADRIMDWEVRQRRRDSILEALTNTQQYQLRERARELGIEDLLFGSLDPHAEAELTSLKRFLMELQHRPGMRGIAVWMQRLAFAESNRRRAQVLWNALTTPNLAHAQASRPRQLLLHWKTGIKQATKLTGVVAKSAIRKYRPNHTPSAPEETPQTPAPSIHTPTSDTPPTPTEASSETPVTPPVQPKTLIAHKVVWLLHDDVVHAMELTNMRNVCLSGPSAELWLRMHEENQLDSAINQVIQAYPDAPPQAGEQLRQVAEELAELGLIVAAQEHQHEERKER